MEKVRNISYVILIISIIFLALSATLGGIALIMGVISLPLEYLAGSIFNDYTIPGIALAAIVGGSALFTALMLVRKSEFALLVSIATGVIIMVFEFVEVLTIGSPAGLARDLQIIYFGLGVVIVFISLSIWFLDLWVGERRS